MASRLVTQDSLVAQIWGQHRCIQPNFSRTRSDSPCIPKVGQAASRRPHRRTRITVLCVVCLTLLLACSRQQIPQQEALPTDRQASRATTTSSIRQNEPDLTALMLPAPFGRHTDDLDEMVKRRNIRALVLLNPIGFFYDNGKPMGAMYEGLLALEAFINKKLHTGTLRVKVTYIPIRPEQAATALTRGVGDFIASSLVITPERQQQLAFTVPVEKDVTQIVVSGPDFGNVTSLEGLGGKQIYVNPVSANYGNLQRVNERLQRAGKAPIVIKKADKNLQDDDLLQMVNAGLVPATITRTTRAKLWSEVLPHLTVHPRLVIESGQQTAWVMRKNNPQLKQVLDEFVAPRAVGTSFGNTLLCRYLKNTKWVKNATSAKEMKKFEVLSTLFKKYAGKYNFDYLMIMAQGYQESMLDQSKRSPRGAVGIMQVIPRYAAAPPINISSVATAEQNIHAGVRILRNIEDRYFNDPNIDPVDKTLLLFASYNAGASRIARLRQQARKQGLDPNKWFGNVEFLVAEDIGQETVTYVGNAYKYFIAYKLALERMGVQDKADRSAPPVGVQN